jgi:ketosteroid isomerase-like protein
MSQQYVQIVRGGYDAFNRTNIPAVLDFYDEHIEWIEAGVGRAPAGTFRGTQSVANEVFATVPGIFNDFRAEPEQFIDGGEKWGTLTAIGRKAKGRILWQQKTEDPLIGGVSMVVFGLGD